MKKCTVIFYFLIFASTLPAQNKRAISVDDLWKMKRINSFDLSADMNKIVFDVTSYDMDENEGQTDIWSINTDGKNLKKLAASGSCLLYTSPSPRDRQKSRMPSSA
jgi:dipeptidyl aminopeptidase/acylaminoacyl peptidase